jgi:hypothetical protein
MFLSSKPRRSATLGTTSFEVDDGDIVDGVEKNGGKL